MASITFDDLLFAKVLAEDRVLSVGYLRELARRCDAGEGRLFVLAEQAGKLSRDDPALPALREKMRRYLYMMNDAIFAEMAERSGLFGPNVLERMRHVQRRERFRRSLREMLRASGYVDDETLTWLSEETDARIRRHRADIVERYRETDFAGLARPLARKSARAGTVKVKRGGETSATLQVPDLTERRAEKGTFRVAGSPGEVRRKGTGRFGGKPVQSLIETARESPIPPPAPSADEPEHAAGPSGAGPPAVEDGAPPVEDAPLPTRPRGRKYKGTMAMTVPDRSVLEGESDLRIGQVVADRYRFESRLGEGAMGMVYLARDMENDGLVAVKLVLDSARRPEIVARFQREILATSFFAHPNVVEIHDAGELDDGSHYMVLEYVQGEELRDLLTRETRVEPLRALDLLEQMLTALGVAHGANVVHKDLKPDNIMLTDQEGREFVKIMDFGLARILDAEEFGDRIFVSMEGNISGSPAYLAPETISGDVIGPHTDLYALGVILYEMLTGLQPVRGKSMRTIIAGHLYKPPPTLAEAGEGFDFPPELEMLVGRLLAKKPSERYSTCAEVLTHLRESVRPALAAG